MLENDVPVLYLLGCEFLNATESSGRVYFFVGNLGYTSNTDTPHPAHIDFGLAAGASTSDLASVAHMIAQPI